MYTYIDVIVPLPLEGLFTYKLSKSCDTSLAVGCRVVVPFGSKKYYTAIVSNIYTEAPSVDYQLKEILYVIDSVPVVTPLQLSFWKWIASYYVCTIGDVYKAAFPSGLRLESESVVSLDPASEPQDLKPREEQLYSLLLKKDAIKIGDLEKESGLINILPVLRRMMDKGIVLLSEELKEGYKPKIENYVRLTAQSQSEAALHNLFDSLKGAPKQLKMLMTYLHLAEHFAVPPREREITKKELIEAAEGSASIYNVLVEKGAFETYTKEISRLTVDPNVELRPLSPLSEAQGKAYQEVHLSFKEKEVVLLHGVTSSGKTEIYIHLIEEAISRGEQILYLLPEIALTTQITKRLEAVFGDKLGVYHSRFSENERAEVWNSLLRDERYQVIIGARSALFLPFSRLGLIIVDEEHETTFKQQDPAPRYHARNAAIVLAMMSKARVLLGTATPSLETYYNTQIGKYGLVELFTRFQDIKLPVIIPVDMSEQRRKKMVRGIFSEPLFKHITQALNQGEQVILFQNRRGFAPMVECASCSWVPKCEQCDVSLTFHKRLNQLTCHYCGSVYPVPISCPSCHNRRLEYRGIGTERVEEEIQSFFPTAVIARMDMDTTRNKKAHERIISDFENKKVNILIGTQMVTKGLDFENVSVVGILNADTLLNYPDFRAFERAYQLMAQVSGRAGRKQKQGTVYLQTNQIHHPVIRQVIANNYQGLFLSQMNERKRFFYPPFYRLVAIYLKHKELELLNAASIKLAFQLKSKFANRVLGPEQPPVGRIQTYFIRKIIIKLEPQVPLDQAKRMIQSEIRSLKIDPKLKSLNVYFDVDPM